MSSSYTNTYHRADVQEEQPKPAAKTMTGVVVKWKADQGYGFVQADAGGVDLFAHASGIVSGETTVLIEGQRVSFCEGTDQRSGRPIATFIKVLA